MVFSIFILNLFSTYSWSFQFLFTTSSVLIYDYVSNLYEHIINYTPTYHHVNNYTLRTVHQLTSQFLYKIFEPHSYSCLCSSGYLLNISSTYLYIPKGIASTPLLFTFMSIKDFIQHHFYPPLVSLRIILNVTSIHLNILQGIY